MAFYFTQLYGLYHFFTSYSYFKLYLFDVLLIFIIFELKGKVTITMIIQKSIILLDEIWTKFFFFSYILHGCLSYVLIFIIKSNK